MRVVAIIQARMTSTRLPGKVMACLRGVPVLGHMLARVRRSECLDAVCIATTTNETDEPIARLAADLSCLAVRGEEHDVLGRFNKAADETAADAIVRLTADCPMIDPSLIDAMVERFRAGELDYLSNVVHRDFPDGLDVEILSRESLAHADREANVSYDREHVTTFIRRSDVTAERRFRIGHHRGPADFSHLRWTVDTADDLENVRRLVDAAPANYSWLEAISTLTREPALLQAMTRWPKPSDGNGCQGQ